VHNHWMPRAHNHWMPLTQACLLPLGRPTQQVTLNVFQFEYVHMFETLLASPEPWLYLHVQLPGGVSNLGNPNYALPSVPNVEPPPKGSRAALDGTMMRVVAVQRQQDARLSLIVQGLGRGRVVRGTQARHLSPLPCALRRFGLNCLYYIQSSSAMLRSSIDGLTVPTAACGGV